MKKIINWKKNIMISIGSFVIALPILIGCVFSIPSPTGRGYNIRTYLIDGFISMHIAILVFVVLCVLDYIKSKKEIK